MKGTVGSLSVGQIAELLAEHHALSPKALRHLGVPRHALDTITGACMRDGRISPETLAFVGGLVGAGHRELIHDAVSDLASYAMWQRHRILIPFDPSLWDELGGTADGDQLSADVFKYLPFPNPYLHFAEPIMLPAGRCGRGLAVVGAYVLGLRHESIPDATGRCPDVVCSTDDPRMFTVTLGFACLQIDTDGVPIRVRAAWNPRLSALDVVWTHIPLLFTRPEMTFQELVDASVTVFYRADVDLGAEGADRLMPLLRRAVACLMYLCCANADLQARRPGGTGRRANRKHAISPAPTVVDAGIAVGAALRRWRVERANPASGERTGGTVRPHRRRAHFRRFRYGKGRALLSEWRYVSMVWVNATRDDAKTITVRRARGG